MWQLGPDSTVAVRLALGTSRNRREQAVPGYGLHVGLLEEKGACCILLLGSCLESLWLLAAWDFYTVSIRILVELEGSNS